MDVRPIRTKADHDLALQEIDRLWGAEPGTHDGDKLEVLATLVEAYENTRFPAPDVSPTEVLHYAITEMGRSEADLARVLGSHSAATQVLAGTRALTLEMIRAISAEWRLPAEALMEPYPVRKAYG